MSNIAKNIVKVVIILVVAILLGYAGYTLMGESGILAAILSFLAPRFLEKKKDEGRRDQYDAQSAAADKAKKDLQATHTNIDAKTKSDKDRIRADGEAEKLEPVTEAKEAEMRRRFGSGGRP